MFNVLERLKEMMFANRITIETLAPTSTSRNKEPDSEEGGEEEEELIDEEAVEEAHKKRLAEEEAAAELEFQQLQERRVKGTPFSLSAFSAWKKSFDAEWDERERKAMIERGLAPTLITQVLPSYLQPTQPSDSEKKEGDNTPITKAPPAASSSAEVPPSTESAGGDGDTPASVRYTGLCIVLYSSIYIYIYTYPSNYLSFFLSLCIYIYKLSSILHFSIYHLFLSPLSLSPPLFV